MEVEDEKLRRRALDALEYDPRVDAAGIGVAVANGVVTLTGHVKTYAEKYDAERIVQGVRGVRGIAQEIQVRSEYEEQTADDRIATRAVSVIGWNVSVPADAVQVKVQQGWVTLTGEVDWNYQRAAAESAVRKLGGVKGVSNLIALNPVAQVSDIKERIQTALRRSAELEAEEIQVSVHGRHVTLTGKVRSLPERYAAERAAWSAPSVLGVDDRLEID
ncbi:MAG: BON domain-containing protein [Achromobacter sp.]|jgi:osmotically-inducible protein OsmY|uniref:BON domain-containing protein n=1 Tax=Achromobacter sp. TaxID=134375 RepID=UPI00258EE699|nr:BON domain-containing protein [Achromobacter sp.]MCW0210978.1 BON domain-containing protein [Achromobacter sp.]